jgi:hypothetical protein
MPLNEAELGHTCAAVGKKVADDLLAKPIDDPPTPRGSECTTVTATDVTDQSLLGLRDHLLHHLGWRIPAIVATLATDGRHRIGFNG